MSSHWIDIQKNAFTRWCNEHLKDRGYKINDLQKDLCDGLLLINLLEIISNKSLGRYNRNPRIPSQKLENTSIAMKFIQSEGIKTVNISNDDITEGNSGDSSAKSDLLKWVQSKIPEYNIKGFTKDWNDGKAICGLVNALEPGLCSNHRDLNSADSLANATKGISLGYDKMGIPKVILPEEMTHPKVDEQAMMTYISYYRDWDGQHSNDASKCRAYGPGLVEGVAGTDAAFEVDTPNRGQLKVVVEGPKDKAQVIVTPTTNGHYNVIYKPTVPGVYKVQVTLDGNHIPGSTFHVTVLEVESLGGEGKIRVFYTTTTASNAKTRPLQELLERKKVHLRPDFEPWIPVDIMERDDREAVFRKAGTRTLPIVFIDDVLVEDLFTLEQNGQLDKLLHTNEQRFQSLGLKSNNPHAQ